MTRLGALTLRNRTAPRDKAKLCEIWSPRVDEATELMTKGQLIMRLARYLFSTAAAENEKTTFRWFYKMRENSTLDQIMQFSSQLESPMLVEACSILQDWVARRSWLTEQEKNICREIIEVTQPLLLAENEAPVTPVTPVLAPLLDPSGSGGGGSSGGGGGGSSDVPPVWSYEITPPDDGNFPSGSDGEFGGDTPLLQHMLTARVGPKSACPLIHFSDGEARGLPEVVVMVNDVVFGLTCYPCQLEEILIKMKRNDDLPNEMHVLGQSSFLGNDFLIKYECGNHGEAHQDSLFEDSWFDDMLNEMLDSL